MDHIFKDKYVAMTGVFDSYRRYDIMMALRTLGARRSIVVDKRVSFILVGKTPGRRLEEAKRLGVRIVYEDELIHLLGTKGHVSETEEIHLLKQPAP